MNSAGSPTPVRIWHDDIRPAPEGWVWCRTNDDAIRVLSEGNVAAISLDHDLGLHHYTEEQIRLDPELTMGRGQAEETGLDLVRWMIENDRVPAKVAIHSWNPAGAKAMKDALYDAGHHAPYIPYAPPGTVILGA